MNMGLPQSLLVGYRLLFFLITGVVAQVPGKTTVLTKSSVVVSVFPLLMSSGPGEHFLRFQTWFGTDRRRTKFVSSVNFYQMLTSGYNEYRPYNEYPEYIKNILLQAARNYDMEITSLVLGHMNRHYLGPNTSVTLHGPNEYSHVLDILQNLPADLKSVYQGFEKNSRNEYVTSLGYRGTVCDDLSKEIHRAPMFTCLHFTTMGFKECPFKKGIYSGNRLKCSAADGTVMAPGKYWRLNMSWVTKDNTVILQRNAEFTIIRKTMNGRPPK